MTPATTLAIHECYRDF